MRIIDRSPPKTKPWTANILALSISPAPRAVAMSAVVPVATPLPSAMMMKKTGKESDRAASAWVDMTPAKYVSTTLNMVLKKNPTLAGTAMAPMTRGTGSVVILTAVFMSPRQLRADIRSTSIPI
ncbi:MAG: hypothetical protein BWX71_02526 [Deltaproteobacteria bacterium ADurb.Bin072]|nr:MAG: hypothetical protein BWX71_02526 [Deltaproteobacteria bacterium ADurb.Bin072]